MTQTASIRAKKLARRAASWKRRHQRGHRLLPEELAIAIVA
jgi:hypothetical protein